MTRKFASNCSFPRRSWRRRSCRWKRRASGSKRRLPRSGTRKPSSSGTKKRAKKGLVSDKEVATYRYKLEELTHDERSAVSETKEFQHKVGELEAEIAQSKLDLSRTQVRAPFAGFVTARTVNIGQRLRPLDNLFNLGRFLAALMPTCIYPRRTRGASAPASP